MASNAEASSSRIPLPPGYSGSGGNRKQLSLHGQGPTSSGSGTVTRKVRTVPPSAIYDPPSPPPTSIPNPLPSADHPNDPPPSTTRRPRLRVRYSTDTSSPEDTTDDDDDDPPWWTFTQRGMQKMRQRNQRRPNDDTPAETGGAATPAESEVEKKVRRKLPGSSKASRENSRPASRKGSGEKAASRKGSGEKSAAESRRSSRENIGAVATVKGDAKDRRRSSSPSKNPRQMGFLHQSPIRLPSPLNFRRASPSTTSVPIRRALTRRNSAPESPVLGDVPLPSMGSVLPSHDSNPIEHLTEPEGPNEIRRASTKRQMTAPALPFPRKLGESGENLTDSEAHMITSPRSRAKAKAIGMHLNLDMPHSDSPEDISTRPTNRRKQSRLKPITNHFQHGWPHAGTWQDALYGTFDEEEYKKHLSEKRRTSGHSDSDSKKPSLSFPARPSRLNSSRHSTAPPTPRTPQADDESVPSRQKGLKRYKSRRRRYRQAIAPPTPRGLGFTPTDDEGMAHTNGEQGFDWQNGNARKEAQSAVIPEGDELSRSDTRAAGSSTNEKSSSPKPERKWIFFRRTRPKRKIAVEDDGWKARWKRILFLDARVTIWLRLFNLAIVVVLLALSVEIRLELFNINLPGVIGSSTTLIISYAALTIVHALTAIYREYFGRPIGLWGLRSKMLWVCLDLLFVALWSSAMSLAINDFIATPLECTPEDPWWRAGLANSYIELLESLNLIEDADGAHDASIIGAGHIEGTMGVVLPQSIIEDGLAHAVCRRQAACIGLSLIALLVYGGNMVLSLFRIFEVIKRAADVGRAVMV